MTLDLRPLVSGEQEQLDFTAQVDLELSEVPDAAEGSGSVKAAAGALLLNADCIFTVDTECARCLCPVNRRMKTSVTHYLTDNLADEDAEGYIIVNYKNFDVSALLREDMILSMPVRFLCRPDCKGLCPVCGADLNTTECGHTQNQ